MWNKVTLSGKINKLGKGRGSTEDLTWVMKGEVKKN